VTIHRSAQSLFVDGDVAVGVCVGAIDAEIWRKGKSLITASPVDELGDLKPNAGNLH
jgi:hypothetical protein